MSDVGVVPTIQDVIPSAQEESAVTVAEALAQMAAIIGNVHDARDLLSLMHGEPTHWVMLHASDAMAGADLARSLGAAEMLARGAPIQYAAGRAAFRSLILDVDHRVLIPRPETEMLVDIVLEHVADTPGGIAIDVGTGSGALAISLALEGNFDKVIATDISADALDVARGNAERHGATRVAIMPGSVLAPVRERNVRAVVSNPPYISHAEAAELPPLVRDWEPAVALFAPERGMSVIAALVEQAAEVLQPGGILALEVDSRRASQAAGLVSANGAYVDVRVKNDLTGRERFVVAIRGETTGR